MRAHLTVTSEEVAAILRPLPQRAKIVLRTEARRRGVPVLAVVQEGVLAVAEAIVDRSPEKQETAA